MASARGVRWRRVLLFLALTFGLSWGSMLLAQRAGEGGSPAPLPPVGMLAPAFVVLVLQVFAWPDSGLHLGTPHRIARRVALGYLLVAVLAGALFVAGLAGVPDARLTQGAVSVLLVVWTLLVIRLHRAHGDREFRHGGLQLGDVRIATRFGAGIVAFILLQAALNWASGLGTIQGVQATVEGIPVPEGLYPVAIAGLFLLSVSGTPLGNLALTFGEEYAWRGFLQGELVRLGKRRGVALVGVTWGLWHIPVILSGIHTYPATPAGIGLAIAFFVLWGYVQSYAVLRTNSLWVAAFLHGLVNAMYAFSLGYLVRPADRLLSFGLGIFGVLCLAAIVAAILRDPIWRTAPAATAKEA